MATSEEIRLANDCIHIIERVRADMRANAKLYKSQIGGIPTANIIADIKADANHYQRRLERLRRGIELYSALAQNGLAAIGVDRLTVRSDMRALNAAAQQTFDANITTDAHITQASDLILSTVSEHKALIEEELPTVR